MELYDTNNWARIAFEADSSGLPLRNLFHRAFHSPLAVYFFDGYGAKKLRLAKYPLYKTGRKRAPDNFYIHLGAFKELLLHTGNIIVEVPGYEADDVIATFVKANPTGTFEIKSTDRDFCALIREGVTTPMANLKGVEACDVRLHKTLCGDTGDTITGIVGFGGAAWKNLTPEHKAAWYDHFENKRDATFLDSLGLVKPSHIKWVTENSELLHTFWEIIGFYTVPDDLIRQHTRVGTQNYALADSKLKEMMQ